MNIKFAQEFYAYFGPYYAMYDQFYDGKHPSMLSDTLREDFTRLFGAMQDNLCPVVVDTLVDRLILQGWSTESEAAGNWLADYALTRRLVGLAEQVHLAAALYGDSYAILWPDAAGQPRIYVQDTANIAPLYDGDGNLIAVVKAWYVPTAQTGRSVLRVTTYTAERIERWYKEVSVVASTPGRMPAVGSDLPEDTNQMLPYDADGEPAVANPYDRIPVFHWSNSQSKARYAKSELRDVYPLQTALNKLVIDMLLSSEFSGFRQRWATGIQIPRDPISGEQIETFKAAVDRVWTSASTESRFGDFEQTDLTQFISAISDMRLEIARVSRTPVHLMMLHSGDFPSGEALRTAEAPLSAKVRRRQYSWGDTWEDLAGMLCQMARIDAGQLEAMWDDTTPHSERDQAETAVIKQSAGVSRRQTLSEMGYDDETIERMLEEGAEEAQARAEMAQRAFNAGPGGNLQNE